MSHVAIQQIGLPFTCKNATGAGSATPTVCIGTIASSQFIANLSLSVTFRCSPSRKRDCEVINTPPSCPPGFAYEAGLESCLDRLNPSPQALSLAWFILFTQ